MRKDSFFDNQLQVIKTLQTIASEIDRFEKTCESENYTDTARCWDLLHRFRNLSNSVLNFKETK